MDWIPRVMTDKMMPSEWSNERAGSGMDGDGSRKKPGNVNDFDRSIDRFCISIATKEH